MKNKKNILFFLLFLMYANFFAQKKAHLKKEIIEAIEFAETDSVTKSFYIKKINKNFKRKNVKVHQVFTIEINTLNQGIILKEDKSKNIAFFLKNNRYKFYVSNNKRKLKNAKRGRVSNYPQSSNISDLYNRLINTAKKNKLLDSSLVFCFFSKSKKLTNTLKPILINKNKGLYLTDQNVIYDSLEKAIKSYYGSMNNFMEKTKIEKNRKKVKLNSLSDAVSLIKKDYTNYFKYRPKDTLRNIKIFIQELEKITGYLNSDEKRLLKSGILNKLNFPVNDLGSFGVPFYNKDISLVIFSVLPKEKFYEFLDTRSLANLFSLKAINYLSYSFRRLKKKGEISREQKSVNHYIQNFLFEK